MYAVMGVASMGLELGFNFYENCDTFENDILPFNLPVLLYAASIAGRPFSLAKGPDVLDVIVDYNDIDGEIIVTAEVSDAVMVNSGEQDHKNGGQGIVKVVLYLDAHPDDLKTGDHTWEMSPLDGEFDSSDEIVEISLSTRDFSSGRHSLYVQAMDVDGYLGPVKSVSIEVEREESILPSKYPTPALVTALPTITSQSPNPTTLQLSGNLSVTSPSPNLSQPSITTSEPSRNLTTTWNLSTSPSQSAPHINITSSPTLLPETTSALSTVNTPITSIPSNTATDDSSPLSTNSPTASQTSNNISLQPTTAMTDDIRIRTNSSVSAVVSCLRLMTTTYALTCWMLY
eukprot:CAMPEP_0201710762 /NCGR_PEP_ID=MMETSP0578-20130828/58793_1 /ASSEMBLY_ACC=CAM_ASM_000663 /TAXON_ID=267565 /ORGANISM="Skeletonema grethea, Strain CCMP 1804" /LENGTH=343 /DNA_ID=CAMNT_0048199795 /DNA_START=1122 /DNA_END=2150 /DNA_ORIENTATION=-